MFFLIYLEDAVAILNSLCCSVPGIPGMVLLSFRPYRSTCPHRHASHQPEQLCQREFLGVCVSSWHWLLRFVVFTGSHPQSSPGVAGRDRDDPEKLSDAVPASPDTIPADMMREWDQDHYPPRSLLFFFFEALTIINPASGEKYDSRMIVLRCKGKWLMR
ncbi:unnamed protein product [Trypanosoma congolense IL3000]|uniref:WGS project CAEQ00000000 data, annotated contig 2141 n=1 Tax=Trypanosoma congolense (strain IL3000) TaxID=1068625 RepID=F9WBR9_TRYCI|nr:unnamed protein product [Trypanosoma congolense IL3000]